MKIRPARTEDADQMCALLNAIISAGGTTAHQGLFDGKRMIRHYIMPPLAISCLVAEKAGQVLGFQALERSDPDWTGDDALPENWAIIATFVTSSARGLGVGKALFGASLTAARKVSVVAIDATIRADNALGLAYYQQMGFRDVSVLPNVPLRDGTKVDRIRKAFTL